MSLVLGDIVFVRGGKPAIIVGKDANSGEIFLDDDRKNVQKACEFGLKNGLQPEAREAFKTTLRALESPDKKQEIEDLYSKIQELKKQNTDARLLRYLEGELQYRMSREDYFPKQVSVDVFSVGT